MVMQVLTTVALATVRQIVVELDDIGVMGSDDVTAVTVSTGLTDGSSSGEVTLYKGCSIYYNSV